MKNLKYVFILIAVFGLTFIGLSGNTEKKESLQTSKYIIYDDAVTSANDSLESAWITIDPNTTQVELFVSTSDSLRMDYYIDYTYGSETAITLAVDSLVTTTAANSKGIVLKGNGTNLIPGANQIRWRGYRNASSIGVIGSCHTAFKPN